MGIHNELGVLSMQIFECDRCISEYASEKYKFPINPNAFSSYLQSKYYNTLQVEYC